MEILVTYITVQFVTDIVNIVWSVAFFISTV